MLDTAYRLTFSREQVFQDGRKEVRNKTCGSERDVRTSETVGKICSFLNVDHCASIKTICNCTQNF